MAMTTISQRVAAAANRDVSGFVKFDKDFDAEMRRFFKVLPEKYQSKAVANIYRRSLRPMQSAIRANINSRTGRLAKAVRIRSLRTPKGKDPAAMVHMSFKRDKKYTNKKGEEKTSIGGAWYAYALEYGTSKRYYDEPRHINAGSVWVTTDNSGRLPAQGYFRRGVDSTRGAVEGLVKHNFAKYAQAELDRQIINWNRAADKMVVNL